MSGAFFPPLTRFFKNPLSVTSYHPSIWFRRIVLLAFSLLSPERSFSSDEADDARLDSSVLVLFLHIPFVFSAFRLLFLSVGQDGGEMTCYTTVPSSPRIWIVIFFFRFFFHCKTC